MAQDTTVSEAGVCSDPVFQLGQRVLKTDLALEDTLQSVRSSTVLARVEDETISRLDSYLRCLLDKRRQAELCYILAELNAATARALPAPLSLQAYCANTLGNAIGFLLNSVSVGPEQEVALLSHRVTAYQRALRIWEELGKGVQSAALRNNVGGALIRRFETSGRTADLDTAIELYEAALSVTQEGSPEWAKYYGNLGLALTRRFEALGEMQDLDAAVMAHHKALSATHEDSPGWPGRQANLGLALTRRFEARGKLEDLNAAITAHNQALLAVGGGSLDWATIQVNLGIALRVRFEARGDVEDLNAALSSFYRALSVVQEGSPNWARIQATLGLTLNVRFEALGETRDLDAGIEAHRKALSVAREGSPDWALWKSNLGNALQTRFEALGKIEDLDAATLNLRQALSVAREGSPDWALWKSSLGSVLRTRFEALNGVDDLDAAILAYDQALSVVHEGSPDWARWRNNQGGALIRRFETLGKTEDLEAAVEAFYQALAATPEGTPDWATWRANLGAALSARFEMLRQVEDLDAAIEAYREALKVAHEGSPDWASWQTNLGRALSNRGRINAAIEAYETALEVFAPDTYPDYTLRAALPLGRLLMERNQGGDMVAAVRTYRAARVAADYLYFESLHQGQRERELRRFWGMTHNYAYALAHERKTGEAVEVLEAGRARALAESLLGKHALEAITDLAEKEALEIAWRDVQEAQSIYNHAEEEESRRQAEAQLAQTRRAYYDLMREVFPEYFKPPTLSQVQAIAADTPLVYLAATSAGGLALVVLPNALEVRSGGSAIWLDGLTEGALQGHLQPWGKAYHDYRIASATHMQAKREFNRQSLSNEERQERLQTIQDTLRAARDTWLKVIDDNTDWLWDAAIETVVKTLTDLGTKRATLIPAGMLGLLPLHAAWTEAPTRSTGRRYALDELRFSYTPNARALGAAQDTATSIAIPNSLLAVDNPDSSLDFSDEEVAAALDAFSNCQRLHLAGDDATLERVQNNLIKHNVWHFSTHGRAGWQDPLESGLLLADGEQLTLHDLLALKASARLAVLSGCETGVPGIELPDEVIGLPAGLLQAGVAGVVASLWAVNDSSTGLLMMRFYQCWREEEQEPPEALRSAQRWLRDATNADLVGYFQRHLPEFDGEVLTQVMANRGYRRFALEDPDKRPFSHPFYWAAFYYTGV